MRRQQDQQSRMFDELATVVHTILRSVPVFEFPDEIPAVSVAATEGSSSTAAAGRRRQLQLSMPELTPYGFATCLLAISMLLMLCGSVTFFLGFMLMPWVLGSIAFIYFVGVVSSLSMIGRAILCHNSTPSSPRKEFSSNFLFCPPLFCVWSFYFFYFFLLLWKGSNFLHSSKLLLWCWMISLLNYGSSFVLTDLHKLLCYLLYLACLSCLWFMWPMFLFC